MLAMKGERYARRGPYAGCNRTREGAGMKRARRLHASGLGTALLACIAATAPSRGQDAPATVPATVQDAGMFDVLLRPLRESSTEVTAIAVRAVIRDARLSGGQPFTLSAPIVYAAVPGIADRVKDLIVTDAEGVVPMRANDDPEAPGGFPYFRHWRAQRDVSFPLTVTYRSEVQPIGNRNSPPFGIRPAAGGVSGAGSGFLLIPANVPTRQTRVRWDLSDLEQGSIASSSFGDGDFTLDGPPAALMQGWFLAGPAGRYPAQDDVNGFSATWLGAPPWDPRIEMAQAARIYTYLGRTFDYLGPPPRYRMFTRILDTPPFGGGTALTDSFLLSRGPARPEESGNPPRGLIFHEMIHGFVGGIDAPQGIASWFSEGLTSYYTSELQLRGGFVSPDEYGETINRVARNYYVNPARNWSAARIAETGFGAEQVRRLPYLRGQLYFADLDARIRAATNGARNLDTVLRELFLLRREGWRFDHAAWIETVIRELGPQARQDFESIILEGSATIAPASDAFGPCFAREPATFDEDGQTHEGFRWTRVTGVPDSACVLRQPS
jgi:hypothetical protein